MLTFTSLKSKLVLEKNQRFWLLIQKKYLVGGCEPLLAFEGGACLKKFENTVVDLGAIFGQLSFCF